MIKPGNVLLDVLLCAAELLQVKDVPTPRLDAEVLLSHQLRVDRAGLYTRSRETLSPGQREGFRKLVERRTAGEPVAYIIGSKEFWSLPFEVGPAVLIPRPDTEILVQEVLTVYGRLAGYRPDILEIGTGSGAVSIALARELPNASITATDISPDALELAEKNASVNRVKDRISFLQGNLFEPISGKFDIIASNPPYISEEAFSRLPSGVRDFEPRKALLAGPEGTEFHGALIRGGRIHLKGGGWLLMEMGDGQRKKIEELLREDGSYDKTDFSADYAGLLRVVKARRKA